MYMVIRYMSCICCSGTCVRNRGVMVVPLSEVVFTDVMSPEVLMHQVTIDFGRVCM